MPWGKKNSGDSADVDFDAVNAAEELGDIGQEEQAGDPSVYIRTLESEIEGLTNLLAQAEQRLANAEKKLQEQLSEIERIKVRVSAEADKRVEKRSAEAISQLLDLGDDLKRAIESALAMDHNPDVVDGIEYVRQSFGKRLQALGVRRMEAEGQPFDPALHDAVSMVPVSDPAQNGMILGVIREGYYINDKVLREARVAVGKLQS